MSEVRLTEKLLAGLAGWDVIKQARTIVAENRVLSSTWQPPTLRGVVESGSTSYRAGLLIRRENDAENLCTCRQSREWGTLCAHSVAVGIHVLKPASQESPDPGIKKISAAGPKTSAPGGAARDVRRLSRASADEAGAPLELLVILPPNLAEGLARGKASLFLEGDWGRGRSPLGSLPMDQPFKLDPIDGRLLDAVELLAGGDTPSMLQLSAVDFGGLIEALIGHPRISYGKSQPVSVSPNPWRIPLRAALLPTGEIALEMRSGLRTPSVVAGKRLWILEGTEIRPLGLPPECLSVLQAPLRLSRAQVPKFVSATFPMLQASADLDSNFSPADFELLPQAPRIQLHLAGGLASLSAELKCTYGHRVISPGVTPSTDDAWMPDPANSRRYITRNLASEREALERLERNGFRGPDAQGRWQLAGQNHVLTFFAREFPRLQREWEVTLEERLEKSTEKNLERIQPRFSITPSGEQWFDMQVTFAGGADGALAMSTAEVQRLLRGGQSFTRLKNGKMALLDTGAVEELEQILVDCSPEQHAGGYRINQAQAGFVASTLHAQGWEPVAPSSWRERARQQTGEVALNCPALGDLERVLRPYQKHGVAWLGFLRRNGFGGILADEMGLGKTLQALAHLRAVRGDENAGPFPPGSPAPGGTPSSTLRLPHLVICPTSLVHNWVAEAARFTPKLRVLALHGAERQMRMGEIPGCDLVITSYALIRRDAEVYRRAEFDTVILDEAQHIKNRQTQNAQAVKAVRARHRLVLTGTPLENSVLDLWSIFDFLMPGYLGSDQDFRERYEIPIVREKSESAQIRMARRVRPFLLRRLKREVAPELPPRIDQIVWCELSEEQAAVYQQLLTATRREVTEAVGAQGVSKSRMLILTALLRLRQVCCDLRLLRDDDKKSEGGPTGSPENSGADLPSPGVSSAKLEAFDELLEEVLDGNHRVLVFSQFTRMLALVRTQLTANAIPFSYLDGATRDRAAAVASFQQASDVPVFLISLKAGGVGLNLTAADTVIHFDPWWNPAVEDQATDRAHRIGQSRVVTSYKLITRGTVEEKILNLQGRKRALSSALLSGDETFAQALTWEEIQELLA